MRRRCAVDTVRIVKGASELAIQNAKSAAQSQAAMNIFRVSDLPGRRAEIHWDAVAHPVVMLRDHENGRGARIFTRPPTRRLRMCRRIWSFSSPTA